MCHVYWWMCKCENCTSLGINKLTVLLYIIVGVGFSLTGNATRNFHGQERLSQLLIWTSQQGWVEHTPSLKILEVLVRPDGLNSGIDSTQILTVYKKWRIIFGTARLPKHTTSYKIFLNFLANIASIWQQMFFSFLFLSLLFCFNVFPILRNKMLSTEN